MPMSLIPGTAGSINAGGGGGQGGGDAFEGFAEQLLRAKTMQQQQAMSQLEQIARMTKDSGGRFMPDPKEVEKLAKQAGMPKMLTAEGGGQANPADMFKGIGEAAKRMEGLQAGQMEAATAASQASTAASNAATRGSNLEADHALFLQNLEKDLANPDTPQDKKDAASMMMIAAGKLTPEAGVFMRATPQQRGAVMDTMTKRAMGEMTDTDKEKYISEMAEKTKDDFDTVDQARKYWAATVNHQTPSPDAMPKISPKRLGEDLDLFAKGADMGLSPEMMRDFVANKGDVSKISNWPKDLKTVAMQQLEVMKRNAASTERGVAVQEKALSSESNLRIAQTIKTLSEAEILQGKGNGPMDMQDILRGFEAIRTAQLAKQPVSPDIKAKLEDELAMRMGLTPTEKKSLFGFWTSRGYTFAGAPDPEALKDTKPAAAIDSGASLTSPEVLGRTGPESRQTIEGIIKSFLDFEKNQPKKIKQDAENAAKRIRSFADEFRKGTQATPVGR